MSCERVLLESVKFAVVTYGCAFNQRDSEILIDNLLSYDDRFCYVESVDDARVVVVNTCTVKNLAETKAFREIRRLSALGKRVVVCGCIPQAQRDYLSTKLKDFCVIGVNDLNFIGNAVECALRGEVFHRISSVNFRDERLRFFVSKSCFRFNEVVEIIPVNEGCLGSCSYCKTKQARGNLFSYPIDVIVDRIKLSLRQGVKEFWLTSQDLSCYGRDIGLSLCDLLREVVEIEGDFKVRLGMGNPNSFLEIIDEFLDIFQSDKFYKFLHIPVQSGNDRVLSQMNRGYSLADVEKLFDKIFERFACVTVATDVIVAFPTESEDEFEDSLSLVRKYDFGVLNFSRFWLRSGTLVSRIYKSCDFVDGRESKRRVGVLRELFDVLSVRRNEAWIGWEGDVLVNEVSKRGDFIGRNQFYKQIVLSGDGLRLGDKVRVRVVSVTKFDLRAEVLD